MISAFDKRRHAESRALEQQRRSVRPFWKRSE
jgi:hypothetical protein